MEIFTAIRASDKAAKYASLDATTLSAKITKYNGFANEATQSAHGAGITRTSKKNKQKFYTIEYINAKRDTAQRAFNALIDAKHPNPITQKTVTVEHKTSTLSQGLKFVTDTAKGLFDWFTSTTTILTLGIGMLFLSSDFFLALIASLTLRILSSTQSRLFLGGMALGFVSGGVLSHIGTMILLNDPNNPHFNQAS